MAGNPVPIGKDGFYHPTSEADLVWLVRKASDEGKQIRVRGSTHSAGRAIYTDPVTEQENRTHLRTPPDGPNLNLMLDRYRAWRVISESLRVIEVTAGMHLGADPTDPSDAANLQDSLLYQLFEQRRWTLSNLGGITHQTISGFVATGSAGASRTVSFNESLFGLTLIDGTGQSRTFTRMDPVPDGFHAAAVSMGLLGLISTVYLQCVPTFNIEGTERFTTYEDCPIDLFGAGDGRPTLEEWLRETEFGRLEWWPQPECDRVEVWQATRIGDSGGFEPRPYRQFGEHPVLEQFGCSLFLTVFGNLDDLGRARRLMRPTYPMLRTALEGLLTAWHLPRALARILARGLTRATRTIVDVGTVVMEPFKDEVAQRLPRIFQRVLDLFVPLDRGHPQIFRDYSWSGLPMDGEADDTLIPANFTEAWVPLARSTQVMVLLRDHFNEKIDPIERIRRTGTFAWELYAAAPSPFWMSVSFTTGAADDEWRDGAFRIDPFWFGNNPQHPCKELFLQLWCLLRERGIPFRLHWGKHQPIITEGDPDGWAPFFRAQFPRWDDFLEYRRRMDPGGVFLTAYWRERFGL